MRRPLPVRRTAPVVLAAAAALTVAPAALAQGRAHPLAQREHSTAGAVYTETNASTDNRLRVFYRDRTGALRAGASVATGGKATGTSLDSGHSVIASSSGTTVLAVNAGSNTVSTFAARGQHLLQPRHAVSSGGKTPTSVTISGDYVYVMNAGSGTISGFHLDGQAGLPPTPGSTQRLAGTGAMTDSQIQFTQTGRVLIVDERGASHLQTFRVASDGVAQRPSASFCASAATDHYLRSPKFVKV